MIIEAATEYPDLKLKIFKELDGLSRAEVILATNTSSISGTRIAAATRKPERVIGMHFMNPVPLMRLVEVIRGLATSDETTKTAVEVCKVMGKEPVEGCSHIAGEHPSHNIVNRSYPSFVKNPAPKIPGPPWVMMAGGIFTTGT